MEREGRKEKTRVMEQFEFSILLFSPHFCNFLIHHRCVILVGKQPKRIEKLIYSIDQIVGHFPSFSLRNINFILKFSYEKHLAGFKKKNYFDKHLAMLIFYYHLKFLKT